MPRRELSQPQQVIEWLEDWGGKLKQPASMVLIGSAALLWHAAQRGITTGLPEHSMDADPVTDSDELAWLCYDAIIGSEFEQTHGWHINLMPASVLNELPEGWRARASESPHGNLTVTVPNPSDLLAPKLRRNEPRDRQHAAWAREQGLS
jgi:hypothetical protein